MKLLKRLSKKVYENHHIISKSLRQLPFVQKAIKGGFKLNGFKNLTPLEKFFKKTGEGFHGKHPNYTNQIKDFLENLDISKYTAEGAKDVLYKLNDHIINILKKNKGKKLNEIDLELNKFEH